ncbi:MAG: type V CRISPR-associated protein Cas12b [Verrucomicrobiota bacterium]
MNRIYQGRVSDVQIADPEGIFRSAALGYPDTCVLWQHHRTFQDAVNYYLVALGSLADTDSENRVIRDLHARLADSWDKFPRNSQGASSLRDSLRRTFPELKADSTLRDAYNLILAGNSAPPLVKTLSLSLLLAKCGGDAGIQQNGRAYLPRLCDAKCNPTWDYSAVALESGVGAARLAPVLHSESTQDELEAIACDMDLSWAVKVQPGKTFEGDEARVRLREAHIHLIKLLDAPSPRLAEALLSLADDAESTLRANLEAIAMLPDDISIPRNRKAALDLTFSAIAFKHFPSPVTQCFLKLGVKAPKSTPKVSGAKSGDELFSSLGDDPIKLARGSRGYVFPAFSALPQWAPPSPGEPVWKEFDIAAFKEALKSLNQFNQKTIERDDKLHAAKQARDYMLGISDTLPKSADGEGESSALPRPGKDARWPKVAELEKELGENLSEGDWQLSRSALRGLRDIIEIWNKKPKASTEELQKVVKVYQADDKNKREIGSVQLFLLLCEERYRDLWRFDLVHDGDEETEDAVGILSAAIQVHQLEQEVLRFREPIRLTPAEPALSRRLFMFSDLTDKLAKVKFGEVDGGEPAKKTHFVEAAIALKDGSSLRETRVRMIFTAPRLSRDELLGGVESRWLQPMTAALGLTPPKADGKFDSAVSLMPDKLDSGSVRHLLNFPVSLDSTWIQGALGKAAIWKGQFNGIKDKNLHLHWPGTAKEATKRNPWWENPAVIKNGFTVLSNDLGQRSAGAWSLLKVTCWKPETKRPVRSIGHDGTREWFSEILKSGMHRLPGEDQKVQNNGTWTVEKSGKAGRMAEQGEYDAACSLAKNLGCESVENWLGLFGERSHSELNDQLAKIANRRLTRLGTYHRWSCFSPEKTTDLARQAKVIDAQIVELEAYQDAAVCEWSGLLKVGDVAGFRNRTGAAFIDLREVLETHLVNLANLTTPLRQQLWTWQQRQDGSVYGDLLRVDFEDSNPKIRGQRGLSMQRLEQLDGLRRLFLRYNRSLDREPGIPAKFGREDEGRTSGEPCQSLLDKIDRMKEQRVNQTAHLILAQALGVRLCPHQISDVERRESDMHGEYEKIPGRAPVDFIVIEDLSRYLSSQGRAPAENSRLMKWAHRAVRDKLKMLAEEPFGIPVVETVPAYSSRFHAVNGQPGSRLHELHELESFQLQALVKTAGKTEAAERHRAIAAEALIEQFQLLAKANEERQIGGKVPLTLYFPKAGGPLFLAARDGNPVQADLNAAANLGLRTIAAPECMDVHRRVRAEKEKDGYRPKLGNAREKAAFAKDDSIQLGGTLSKKFGASSSPNFFHEPDALLQADGEPLFDRATLKAHPLVSGVALWSTVNNAIFIRCAELNRQRLKHWNLEDDILI